MKLLVYWGTDDQADLQVPNEVKWEDGTAATLVDYYKNQSATQTSFCTEKGLVTVISPDVIATAKYDVAKSRWVLDAPGGGPFDLDETDPGASDQTLLQEISCYPVAYKTLFDRSHRSHNTVVTHAVPTQPAVQ